MSFAAAASSPSSDGVAIRFHPLRIHGNRARPSLFDSSLFPRHPVLQLKYVVPLRNGPYQPSTSTLWRVDAFAHGDDPGFKRTRKVTGQINLDAFLSVAEVLCIVPSMMFSIGVVVGYLLPGIAKPFQVKSGNVFFGVQYIFLVGAAVLGLLIRHRQWQRISYDNGAAGCDLICRIEKVEDDLRSSTKVVRALSRHLEKLGIRFRVTRKSLKKPISETAELAQKNSEATRALALQADVLEKELGEIQKVLLAMQEQQQKQLDLIIAVAKAGQLFESKGISPEKAARKPDPVSEKRDIEQVEMQTGEKKGSGNDKI